LAELTVTPLDLMSRIMGIEPVISIMAKSTINAANVSIKLNFIIFSTLSPLFTK
jgi:hypothetical protein